MPLFFDSTTLYMIGHVGFLENLGNQNFILKLIDLYSADDDDYLSAEEKVVHTTPTFVSTSSSQLVNEGDTIKLPCFVDKLGKKNCL